MIKIAISTDFFLCVTFLGQNPMHSPQNLAAPQSFQMSPPPTMGHPPMSPPGTQPISMSSCPPMAASPPSAAGPLPMGLSNSQPRPPPLGGAGFQQPPAPQGFPPQQQGKRRFGIRCEQCS